MAYTIDSALSSECFDEVMVSTDSESYAKIAMKYGASVPFLRSRRTASDTASSWEMVEEVLSKYEEQGERFDTFCLLQPTSPLRTADDIKSAYQLYQERANFAVVSVCEAEHSPLWCGNLPDNHEFIDFLQKDNMKQRQAGKRFYRLNGALYIVNISRFRDDHYLYKEGSFAFVMSQERSVDIDTEVDFMLAELLMLRHTQIVGGK